MRLTRLRCLVGVAALILPACLREGEPASVCGDSDDSVLAATVPALAPGVYELVLVAESGSHAGQTSRGRLELQRTGIDDRSPETGDIPFGLSMVVNPLYGWTDIDLEAVGAVSDGPLPTSRDPVYPGVLVWQADKVNGKPEILVIGALGNVRARQGWRTNDGAGTALDLQTWQGGCHRGTWGHWGLLGDGAGRFCLCAEDRA